MTDSEILKWLVEKGAIDMSVLSYQRIMGDNRIDIVKDRIYDIWSTSGSQED